MSIKESDFNPVGLKGYNRDTLRKEYQALKNQIKRQAAELEEKMPDARQLDRLPKLPSYRDLRKNELVYRTLEAKRWLDNPYSNPERVRDLNYKLSASLAESGIKVSPKNMKQFGEYMDKMRALKQDILYDSRVLALAFTQKKRRKGIQNILRLDKSELKNLSEDEYNRITLQAQTIFEELEDDEGGELPF